MENYLRSIRKLHVAAVQGLRCWQAWTKQRVLLLILDYRARQQSGDLSRCCWYSFLVTVLLLWLHSPFIRLGQVWRSPLQLSRRKPSVMEEPVFGHGRLQMRLCLCIMHRGWRRTRVEFAHMNETHECVSAGVVQLSRAFIRRLTGISQWGFSSG